MSFRNCVAKNVFEHQFSFLASAKLSKRIITSATRRAKYFLDGCSRSSKHFHRTALHHTSPVAPSLYCDWKLIEVSFFPGVICILQTALPTLAIGWCRAQRRSNGVSLDALRMGDSFLVARGISSLATYYNDFHCEFQNDPSRYQMMLSADCQNEESFSSFLRPK